MLWPELLPGDTADAKVTTAMVDTLCFRAPAYPNDTLVLAGKSNPCGTDFNGSVRPHYGRKI